ncbi:MAG: hypothetical protein Q8P12_03200, partial [bacterium]|nr:hypothetical protein [bacterium]
MAHQTPSKGLNQKMQLIPDCLDKKKILSLPTRDGYGAGLVEAGTLDPNVVVMCADLSESTRCLPFKNT